MDCKFLFPYEYLERGSKIIIYGAGVLGLSYLEQMYITNYAEVVAFIDKNYTDFQGAIIPVYPIEKITEMDFDYIVVALQTKTYESEIYNKLKNLGIDKEKIIYISSRTLLEFDFISQDEAIIEKSNLAYNAKELSVAIKLNGAIGDNIVRKKVIESIIKMVPNCVIDIYSPAANTFLPSFYLNEKNVKNFITDGGAIYNREVKYYNIGISISNFITLDKMDLELFKELYPEFYYKMQLLKKWCKEQEIDFTMPLFTHFMKNIKRGANYFTSYGCNGIFDVIDDNSHILLNKSALPKFYSLNLEGYITINFGNGISMNNTKIVAKQWPEENFESLAKIIKYNFGKIKVVQLGGREANKIKNVDRYVLGEDMEIVKYILKNSLIHIDIDGGLVHLASQLGTKCIVMFGPTQVEYFGYKENINIKAGNCHNCYGMYKDINKCARDMEKPECMYSITPQMVFEKIEKYFKSIGII